MSTGDLPSCLCKRGSKCHKFSPPNIGTGILQDKSVEALWNVDSLVRRHMEGNPHRTFVMRLLMKPTVVVGKNSLVITLLTEKNDCMYNMLKTTRVSDRRKNHKRSFYERRVRESPKDQLT